MDKKFTRRDFLKSTAGVAATTSLGGVGGSLLSLNANAAMNFKPEKGANLRILRWKRFVQGDEDLFMANVEKFTKQTGVKVTVDNAGWEDVRPKAAVAANIGSGPDIIIGWFDDPHQYPDKLVDVSDIANYLGKKYGGWYDGCRKYGMRNGKWISVPLGFVSNAICYRQSHIRAAGFDTFPNDTKGFLKLCRALKTKGTPAGFPHGHAVGDGNNYVHWLLWSHGGKMVDKRANVVLNSSETIASLNYAKDLYETFVPGTLSWGDANNNKAFLDNQVSVTANAVSIYYAAKNSDDPRLKNMAPDIYHVRFPVGPVGRQTELFQITQMMLFKHSRYPNAGKEFIRFIMEADQYDPWLKAATGYVVQPLKDYEKNPMWTSDPKYTAFRDIGQAVMDNGHDGPLGYASAAAMADYILVDMYAEAVSGSKSPKEAAERAAERAKRYYQV